MSKDSLTEYWSLPKNETGRYAHSDLTPEDMNERIAYYAALAEQKKPINMEERYDRR